MKPGLLHKLLLFLAFLVLLDGMVIPDIWLSSKLPSFQFTDFIWPIGLVLILPKLQYQKTYAWVVWVCLFAVYMSIPIAVNGRIREINDWFELYKVVKLAAVFLLFYQVAFVQFAAFIRISFIGLVLINVLHFYNVMHINDTLQAIYGTSDHWVLFGKDSLGNPAVKRMLGTLGNPNSNALLFLFFAVYFVPTQPSRKAYGWFFSALLMVFMCQSRTSLLGCGAVIVGLLFVLWKNKAKNAMWQVPMMGIGVYVIGLMLATSFFNYNGYSDSLLDGSAMHSYSLRSRWETWGILWDMIRLKPWFGYGPFKSYFVANHLYSENEYMLMFWRYGIFGLLFYLGIFLIPLKSFWKQMMELKHLRMGLFTIIMLIAALTNNPLTERSIALLFVFLLAQGVHEPHPNEEAALDRK